MSALRLERSQRPGVAEEPGGRSARRTNSVQLGALGGLALVGALRWNTLLSPGAPWRLLGMAALCLALAAAGQALRARRVPATRGLLGAVGLICTLGLCGWPLGWLTHLRLAVLWRSVQAGLNGIPSALVPYNGGDPAIRQVTLLGAGMLLVLAALAVADRSAGWRGRSLAGLALLVVSALPTTLVHPGPPGGEGILLFTLLCALAWPHAVAGARPAVLALIAAAGLAALPLAAGLRPARPWLSPQRIADSLVGRHLARFSWAQGYGTLNWPRSGRTMLSVQAERPGYWKAENLDSFDVRGWASAPAPLAYPTGSISAPALRRWSQTLTVTVSGLSTRDVIAAGTAAMPQGAGAVQPGRSPGTWVAGEPLAPGSTYREAVYDPHPSAAALSEDRQEPAAGFGGYLSITIPATANSGGPLTLTFGAFGQRGSRVTAPGYLPAGADAALRGSAYGGVYAVARRLATGAPTPATVARRAMALLAHGFRYDEHPPPSPLPLVSFLGAQRAGYCQHFAGAMALLLRMDGIPARVGAGFTTGTREGNGGAYVVEDIDAHAWVEAWFPSFGWVPFDPTPAAAPELSRSLAVPDILRRPSALPSAHGLGEAAGKARSPVAPVRRAGTAGRPGGENPPPVVLALALVGLLALAALGRLTVRVRPPAADALVTELERAMRRLGRPLPPGATLAGLERSLRDDPQAAGYVHAIVGARYGPGGDASGPTAAQRRALRRWIREGAGWGARARALLALPPLWVLLH